MTGMPGQFQEGQRLMEERLGDKRSSVENGMREMASHSKQAGG